MRYKTISITPPTADLSGQLVRIKIDADADIGAVSAATGYDVYFTNSTGSTQLPFSRLEWSITSGKASGVFDVLCDVPVAGLTIRVYYGGDASTDRQNRAVTYAGYWAVYPLQEYTNGVTPDVSGHTRHLSGPNAVWYTSSKYGKMLANNASNLLQTRLKAASAPQSTVSITSLCEVVATTGYGVLAWTLRANDYFTGGMSYRALNNGVVYSPTESATLIFAGGNASIYTAVLDIANGTITVDNIHMFCNGSAITYTKSGYTGGTTLASQQFGIFNTETSALPRRIAMRDIRIRNSAITAASASWEYANLATPASTLAFGTEKRITRRRHNQILEAF